MTVCVTPKKGTSITVPLDVEVEPRVGKYVVKRFVDIKDFTHVHVTSSETVIDARPSDYEDALGVDIGTDIDLSRLVMFSAQGHTLLWVPRCDGRRIWVSRCCSLEEYKVLDDPFIFNLSFTKVDWDTHIRKKLGVVNEQ